MLEILLAIPGLGALLQGLLGGLVKLLGGVALYQHGKAVARDEDALRAARAEAGAAQVRYQAELERRTLERRVALDDPAAVREQLRQYRARRLGATRRG